MCFSALCKNHLFFTECYSCICSNIVFVSHTVLSLGCSSLKRPFVNQSSAPSYL